VSLSVLAVDTIPDGWFKAGSKPAEYEMGLDSSVVYDGKNSAYIESKKDEIEGFGTLMQNSSVEEYKGKRVQLSMYVKTLDVTSWAGGWFRIDGNQKKPLAFDNMNSRQITQTTGWTLYKLVLDVPDTATNMAYGVLLNGAGKVWFDQLAIEIVDKSVPVTDMYATKLQKKAKNLSFEND
jgi:hypothetical protein